MSQYLFRGCVFFLLMIIPVSVLGADSYPAEVVFTAVKNANSEIMEKSDCLHIKCERLHTKDILQSQYSGGDIPLQWELGWTEKSFYAKKTFFPTDAQKQNAKMFIPEEPCVMIVRGTDILEWDAGRKVCYIDRFLDRDINFIQEWSIFELLGFDIAKKILTSTGDNYNDYRRRHAGRLGYEFVNKTYMAEAVADGRYVVKDEMDVVGDTPCVVMEWPERDKVWLDPERGFALLKRVVYDEKTGQILYVAHYENHSELKNRIFLPGQISVDYYADSSIEPQKNWGKIAKTVMYNISVFDSDHEGMPEVFPPPGTRVVDGVRKIEYTITEEYADPFAGPTGQGIKRNRHLLIRAALVVAGSVLILLGAWLKYRKREIVISSR
ncbi:MAG: hypothetical protein Q4G68_08170 [Planctomycetia bacterium]|nr:hypothetical protein [Planctomycetia bacterium]